MQNLLDNFTSIQWWVGVVIVGIAINLFSIFLKNKFDKYLSEISNFWRQISEARKKQFELDVNKLKDDPQELIMISFFELKSLNNAIHSLLMSIILFMFGFFGIYLVSQEMIVPTFLLKTVTSLCYLSASLTILSSFLQYKRTRYIRDIINAARENKPIIKEEIKRL